MNNRFELMHRKGFLEGCIEGITIYAVWRNGEQEVGCLNQPLKQALVPYKEELEKINQMIRETTNENTKH